MGERFNLSSDFRNSRRSPPCAENSGPGDQVVRLGRATKRYNHAYLGWYSLKSYFLYSFERSLWARFATSTETLPKQIASKYLVYS